MARARADRRTFLGVFAAVTGGLILPRWVRAAGCFPTSSEIPGPFYLPDAPRRTQLAARDEPGDPLLVQGRVVGPDCRTGLKGTYMEVWHADVKGEYHNDKSDMRLRGIVMTDESGAFSFTTIMPGAYKIDGGYRPAHIHLIVGHGRHQTLTTQLYFKGDPYLGAKDACGDECDSSDPDRILELKKVEGGRRLVADARIVLAARRTQG